MASPAEAFAACLLFARASGERQQGRLIPTAAEIDAILAEQPPYWTEAIAVGEAFVRQVQETTHQGVVAHAKGFARGLDEWSQKLGGVFGAPPAGPRTR